MTEVDGRLQGQVTSLENIEKLIPTSTRSWWPRPWPYSFHSPVQLCWFSCITCPSCKAFVHLSLEDLLRATVPYLQITIRYLRSLAPHLESHIQSNPFEWASLEIYLSVSVR